MTEEAVAYIKKNISHLTSHYKNGEDPKKWLRAELKKNPFVEVDALEIEDFDLFINTDKPSSNDVMNIKIMYDNLIELNDSFATDERLWAGLAHTVFYDYMLKRWPNNYDENSILNHFFFKGGKPRCYMVNTLARLWWLGKMTYIDDDNDHYKILDYIAHDLNGYGFTLYGSNWSNNKKLRNAFFDAVFEYEKESGNQVGRLLFNEALQHVNALGGIYVIDACSERFIIDNVKDYLHVKYDEMQRETQNNKNNNMRLSGVNKFDNIIRAINLLGGIATPIDLFNKYASISGRELNKDLVTYLKDNIFANSPGSTTYTGKPIFYAIVEDGVRKLKISAEYLTNDNWENRNAFISKQINSLTDEEKIVFNIVTSISKNSFSENEILSYAPQLSVLYPDIEDIEGYLKKNLAKIQTKGLIERYDQTNFKKSFNRKDI